MAGKATILVVDDDTMLLSVMRKILIQEGYHVVTSTFAEEGLRLAESHAADLAVTDLVLPTMGGLEFAWRLHETMPDCPVILISGYAERQAVMAHTVDERTTFLGKPFDADEFRMMVRRQLGFFDRQGESP